jgi:hypothetical protein
MYRKFLYLAAAVVISVGFASAPTAFAQGNTSQMPRQNAPGLMQGQGMMGGHGGDGAMTGGLHGMGGMNGMMGAMDAMSRMANTCNTMMERAMNRPVGPGQPSRG